MDKSDRSPSTHIQQRKRKIKKKIIKIVETIFHKTSFIFTEIPFAMIIYKNIQKSIAS